MKKRLSVAIFLVLVMGIFSVSVQASECPNSNVIEDMVTFQWTQENGYKSGTLEFGEANYVIDGQTLRTRSYRQEGGSFSIPGPTMYMSPGETYVLTFKNTLPYDVPGTAHNEFQDPNISNIHTHGLHVSGETPADNVKRLINGGQCGDYVYEIPSDHMGGTLWYHPHHHGSTYLQVAGGAIGLLIVDDSNDGIPSTVAGMAERQVAIAFLDTDAAGTGGDTLLSGSLQSTWTVNGKIEGNLCMPANEWQHWRVLLADPDAKSKEVAVGPECEVALLARDGVWRRVGPKDLSTNSLVLTGASRADLAVRCSADSTITVDDEIVANVYADGTITPNTAVGPGSNWSAIRPNYLRDLRGIPGPLNEQEISLGARTINGEKFDADIPTFSIIPDSIQEWTIKAATRHPFHLHVYHMQMNGVCGSDDEFEDGEYYDTVAGSGCLARFDTNPATSSVYDGRTIMHCHILQHEDLGAMGWVDVLGGFSPPAFPDPANQQALYQCDGGPPVCVPTETPEVTCNDGLDNDCDNLTDGNDPDCQFCEPITEGPSGDPTCFDGLDNDCDGLIDANDPDCQDGTDCSYTNKEPCNDDDSCRWNKKKRMCVPK